MGLQDEMMPPKLGYRFATKELLLILKAPIFYWDFEANGNIHLVPINLN